MGLEPIFDLDFFTPTNPNFLPIYPHLNVPLRGSTWRDFWLAFLFVEEKLGKTLRKSGPVKETKIQKTISHIYLYILKEIGLGRIQMFCLVPCSRLPLLSLSDFLESYFGGDVIRNSLLFLRCSERGMLLHFVSRLFSKFQF